jgi:hypothetical protein
MNDTTKRTVKSQALPLVATAPSDKPTKYKIWNDPPLTGSIQTSPLQQNKTINVMGFSTREGGDREWEGKMMFWNSLKNSFSNSALACVLLQNNIQQ